MADHNENLKDTLNEEIEHADQKPAEEHYSLNDDRRVKVLSPGMLVAKRFIRNRMAVTGLVILIFMFVFSFIGGLVSPYGQDQFFYTDKTIRKSFGEAKENTEFRPTHTLFLLTNFLPRAPAHDSAFWERLRMPCCLKLGMIMRQTAQCPAAIWVSGRQA